MKDDWRLDATRMTVMKPTIEDTQRREHLKMLVHWIKMNADDFTDILSYFGDAESSGFAEMDRIIDELETIIKRLS